MDGGESKVLSQEADALMSLVPGNPRASLRNVKVVPAQAPDPMPSVSPSQSSPLSQEAEPYQAYPSGEIESLRRTVADLSRRLGSLMDAIERLDAVEERQRRLEQIYAQNAKTCHLIDSFECDRCKSAGVAGISVKCTCCGQETMLGRWPDNQRE